MIKKSCANSSRWLFLSITVSWKQFLSLSLDIQTSTRRWLKHHAVNHFRIYNVLFQQHILACYGIYPWVKEPCYAFHMLYFLVCFFLKRVQWEPPNAKSWCIIPSNYGYLPTISHNKIVVIYPLNAIVYGSPTGCTNGGSASKRLQTPGSSDASTCTTQGYACQPPCTVSTARFYGQLGERYFVKDIPSGVVKHGVRWKPWTIFWNVILVLKPLLDDDWFGDYTTLHILGILRFQ